MGNEQIQVKRGDVLGFYFTPSTVTSDNPPSTRGCIADTLNVRNPVHFTKGQRYYFKGGWGGWTKCRSTEMSVQVQPGGTNIF